MKNIILLVFLIALAGAAGMTAHAQDQKEIQRYAEAVNSNLGGKFVEQYYAFIQQRWQPRDAYTQIWNRATQEYSASLANKPCPACSSLYAALINKGWKPINSFYGLWAYSNGWLIGYRHGQWYGYFRNQPLAPTKTQFDSEYLNDFTKHRDQWKWWTGPVLGMYQMGYMDGKQQGLVENWGNAKEFRYPVYGDYQSYFRAVGIDVCDPFGDLPLNTSYWGPFGGPLCLTR